MSKKYPVKISYGGETLTVREWSNRTGLGVECIRTRMAYKWSVHEMLTVPARNKNKVKRIRARTLVR